MKIPKIALFPLLFALPLAASAKSPWRVPVHFAITNDAGVGYSWFVVGSHPDLGNWDVLHAAPLAWHDGNVWSADIGIQAGTELPSTDTTGYKFVKRPTNADEYPDGGNTQWEEGANHALSVPAEPDAPCPAKRVVFRCPWDPPVQIVWTTLSSPSYDAETEWHATDLVQTAPGRYEGFAGEPGEWMRFTFSGYENGEQKWYHFYGTTNEDFFSPLDAFCVDAGQIFDYEPTNGVSDSRIVTAHVDPSDAWASTIAGRDIRVYLPRGYDENTSRRYPVLYFSDGQNVFSGDGATMGGWKVDTAADYEIRGGRMREAILVAVPCRETPPDGYPAEAAWAGRLWEYLPSTDILIRTDLQGLGTDYANFLVHNVRPTIDYNICKDRTLGDRANTGHVGSSAGGLLSYFLGAYTNVFGLVGAVSGVYNNEYIPNFRQWCLEHPGALGTNAIKRIWLDTGTEETNIDDLNLYESNWDALTLLLYAGHVPNKSLHFGVYSGWQGEHNEPAWADRLADVYRFLLPATDDFNPLLPREIRLDGHNVVCPLFPGETARLVGVPALAGPRATNAVAVFPPTDRPWTTAVQPVPLDATGFYWLETAQPANE